MRPALECIAVVIALAALGCGGKPAPAKPRPIDPAVLAKQVHDDLRQLAEISQRLVGQCSPLVGELRVHVARMQSTKTKVDKALEDVALGRELRRELRAYDQSTRGLSDRAGEDLARSYLACNKDEQLLQVIQQLPEY